ncbi:tetratricopeptide repeat protein [Thalassovita sp.]|jgi:TPR repeat protein|uniref:tetratricopeptide repeat protein n=1 Tax=Thalassovita sp. TaxID=1979401 RepID=UPI003B5A1252
MKWLLTALLLASPAAADDLGTVNPDEGGITMLRQELARRPDMAGFRCWVVYETQKGGLHSDAFEALLDCARSGNAPSMILTAHAYENGLGVPVDAELAAYWVKQAALQGYAVGMLHYGMALLDGAGVPQDTGQARFWLERAAKAGDTDARRALMRMQIS